MPLHHPNRWNRTAHQARVEAFMELAKQELPESPTEPSEAVRLLRAKLIFEEAMETITALGVSVKLNLDRKGSMVEINSVVQETQFGFTFSPSWPFDMVEAVDGCCDLSVVTTGTLSALGVADEPLLSLVDRNNLDKFGPGHSWREDGKLIKPPGHTKPDILAELVKQGYSDPIKEMDPQQ